MPLRYSLRFWRAYERLTAVEQRQVDSHLALLDEDPRHPSLRARKWENDVWYARASRDLRFVYEVREGYYFVIDVGHHDIERSF